MRDDRARLTSERRRGVASNSVLLLRRKSEREPAETGLASMIATAMRRICIAGQPDGAAQHRRVQHVSHAVPPFSLMLHIIRIMYE